MKVTVLVLLALLSAFAARGQEQTYCGRELANTLAAYCDNLVKRVPWLARSSARGFRSRRQVVSECCDKPCSISELLSYCAN